MTWTTISGTSEEDSGDGFARIVEIAFGLTHFVILSILVFFFFFGCFFDLKKKKDREREGGNEVFVAVLFGGKIYIINIYIQIVLLFFFSLLSSLVPPLYFHFSFFYFFTRQRFFWDFGGVFWSFKAGANCIFSLAVCGGFEFPLLSFVFLWAVHVSIWDI